PTTDELRFPRIRGGRWPRLLRRELLDHVPACRRVRRQNSTRHETSRSPGGAAHQVRAVHQPQDRQGARPRNPAIAARSRRRGDRMKRRAFITLLGGAAVALPLTVRARQAAKMRTIGYLSPGAAPGITALFDALPELGWIEGKNIAFERRWAENRLERLPELAAELVRLNVDVIVAVGTLAPLAAKRATSTIPIVMTAAGDPLGSGLVASLAQPGGNITGMSLMTPDVAGQAAGIAQRGSTQGRSRGRALERGESLPRAGVQSYAERGPDTGGRGSIARGAGSRRPRRRIQGGESAAPGRIDRGRRPSPL